LTDSSYRFIRTDAALSIVPLILGCFLARCIELLEQIKQLVLSDGQHFIQGMLATQLNHFVAEEKVQVDTLIKVLDCMKNRINNQEIVIVLNMEVLHPHPGHRIGNPTDIAKAGSGPPAASAGGNAAQPLYQPLNNRTNGHGAAAAAGGGSAAAAAPKPSGGPYGGGGGGSNPYGGAGPRPGGAGGSTPIGRIHDPSGGQAITSIANLNMYNNRWTIRARCTSKADIKSWSNAKGEGQLFSAEWLDSSGMDIRSTFFREAVDKFHPMIHIGSVYRLSGGRLKVADMRYNTCKSNFEITFDQNSEIHLETDDGQIQRANYDFTKIADVEQVDPNKNVDILAIVKHVSEPARLTSKKTGNELFKCDLTLVDDSGVEINMTVWGEEKANRAPSDMANCPVVAFRRARVSDFGGRSLSAGDAVDIQPDIPEAHALKQWWDSTGSAQQGSMRSLSGSGGSGGRADNFGDRKVIASIKEESLGQNSPDGKPDWLSFKATITFLKKDREGGAWYTACPNAGEPCKNRYKVTQTTDGQYFCEKCGGTFPNCVRRWIFSGVVEDDTGSTWVSFFNEQAEQLLGGITADEAYDRAYSNDGSFNQDEYESIFARQVFTEWIFKCKVKNEMVNDEQRVKTSVFSLTPIDYVKESNDLIAALEKL